MKEQHDLYYGPSRGRLCFKLKRRTSEFNVDGPKLPASLIPPTPINHSYVVITVLLTFDPNHQGHRPRLAHISRLMVLCGTSVSVTKCCRDNRVLETTSRSSIATLFSCTLSVFFCHPDRSSTEAAVSSVTDITASNGTSALTSKYKLKIPFLFFFPKTWLGSREFGKTSPIAVSQYTSACICTCVSPYGTCMVW